MKCPICGTEVADGVEFCPSCGTMLKDEKQTNAQMDTQTADTQTTDTQTASQQEYQQSQQQYQQGAQGGQYYQQGSTTDQYYQQNTKSSSGMDAKTTSIIGYITWIGWLVAYFAGDKEGAKFFLNQALVLNILSLLGFIPVIGWLWNIFIFVCWILGLIAAINQEHKEIPLIGKIHILD